MKVVRTPKACYGCRTCELVCSFHHRGYFSPKGGSIKVLKDNRTGEIRWFLNSSCDFCKEENQPLCVRYCTYEALALSEKGN
jgi:Fe-S-cluster-containing hydrogenase component 2